MSNFVSLLIFPILNLRSVNFFQAHEQQNCYKFNSSQNLKIRSILTQCFQNNPKGQAQFPKNYVHKYTKRPITNNLPKVISLITWQRAKANNLPKGPVTFTCENKSQISVRRLSSRMPFMSGSDYHNFPSLITHRRLNIFSPFFSLNCYLWSENVRAIISSHSVEKTLHFGLTFLFSWVERRGKFGDFWVIFHGDKFWFCVAGGTHWKIRSFAYTLACFILHDMINTETLLRT